MTGPHDASDQNHPALTPAQRAGQRLMVGFNGSRFSDTLKHYIENLKVGGLILFSQNLESSGQISELCHAAQSFARRCGQPPLFIAIDQEGGVVARLKPPFTQFDGNPHMRSTHDAREFARITASELSSIGVNMNMAPVLDVLPPNEPSVMTSRAFGHDPKWVAQLGTAVIDTMQRRGIMAVAKHFPGIGRTVLDSHEDLPDSDLSAEALATVDLVPFQAAVESEVAGIMLSHIRYLQIDPQWPASLSATIAIDLLRQKLGYDGLVLTDDFDMGAIAKHFDIPAIVAQCLAAQVDILLICHESSKIEQACREIVRRCKTSEELSTGEKNAVARIMAAKKKYLAAEPG
ncbi:MAG: beta-N-acetylhexosaminidase [Desulfobacteraceae bacterium]|jgi:beta-N-acetylhexosaminidase